ncbi:FAD-dependent monooxygenase [Nonomuraea sp. NPDC001636]|uniref:FAD-dependent monooxygenase n=1 Tax=Nonomuraea sp. NPDC001636 TaxID=3154391 RepID=UPI00331F9C04
MTAEPEPVFVRFQSPAPNGRGTYPGVFGLVNSLAAQGLLSDEEEAFRRANNAWYEANFTDPTTVTPDVYRRDVNPMAAAWFKASATRLVERVPGYLAILAAHGVECGRLLEERAGELGVDLRRGHEVVGASQDDTAATLDVRGPDGPCQVAARYVVGSGASRQGRFMWRCRSRSRQTSDRWWMSSRWTCRTRSAMGASG